MEYPKKINETSSYFFIIIATLISIFRIYLGNSFPYWYLLKNQLDELLLINNAHLGEYFASWNIHTLSKTLSYPLFLKLINISGLPYGFVLSILWIIAGIFVAYGIYKYFTKNKIYLILAYAFIIFLPTGLDLFISGRVYRNAVIAPFLIIFLSTLFIFMNKVLCDKSSSHFLTIWAVLLGAIFTFNYYIKEDNIGILLVFLLAIISLILFKLISGFKNKKFDIKSIIICIIPVLIFLGATFAYCEVNHEKFGVYDINTRTEGELGEFYHNLLLIEDDNKTDLVWVPYSTIEKAWQASPTLQSRPDLLDNWTHSGWANGNLKENNLTGDTIAWSLRDALHASGLYGDEKSASDFISKANDELDLAFKNGNLTKSDEIFISSYACGKSVNEIYDLNGLFFSLLKTSILYNDLGRSIEKSNVEAMEPTLISGNESSVGEVEKFLNMNIFTKNEFSNDNFDLGISNIIIIIYQLISIAVVIVSVIGFILCGVRLFSKKFMPRNLLFIFIFETVLLGLFIVQLFGLTWFASFLGYCSYSIAYSSNCQAIFALFEVLSISSLFLMYDGKNIQSLLKKEE